MKISSSEEIVKTLQPGGRTQAQPSGNGQFGTILKETVEKSTKPAIAPHQTQFVDPLAAMQLDASIFPDSQAAVGQVESLLDMLDSYRSKLADPRVSLKQLDPLVQEMSGEKQKLMPVLKKLPDCDGLKGILKQALITTSVEIARFYRGDYVAP